MALNVFGISIPTPSLPKISLPKISLPKLPKVSLPKVSLPDLPKVSLPKVSLPSLPKIDLKTVDFSAIPNLPKTVAESGSAAVSALRLASQGILPIGMKAGTKAAQRYLEEQAQRAKWAAEAAAEAIGSAGAAAVEAVQAGNVPKVSLPKVSLPDLPKVSLPKIDLSGAAKAAAKAVSLPVAAGAAAVEAVQSGNVPKISIPDLPKVSLPKIDLSGAAEAVAKVVSLPVAAGAATVEAVQGGTVPKISLPNVSIPDLPKISLPKIDLSGAAKAVSLPSPPKGGNIIDTIINARDKSYDDSIEHIGAGNYIGGGSRFAATAAADVLLPLDLVDVGNKLVTGRGDEIDRETMLWAALDAISIAAIPFTLGGSYAAARALKAGKVVSKTAKAGGEMGKLSAITKLSGAIQAAGKSSGAARTTSKLSSIQRVPVTTVRRVPANVSTAARKQVEAARKAAEKQYADVLKRVKTQYSKIEAARKAPKVKTPEIKTGKTSRSQYEAMITPVEATTKIPGKTSSKVGSALKYSALGVGAGAIGLTAMGALGGPAQQQEEVIPPGGEEVPWDVPYQGGGVLPYSWEDEYAYPEYPEFEIPDFMNPDYGYEDGGGGGEYLYPDESGGYVDENGYYAPGYYDPLGLEEYGQEILSAAEGIPVVGDVAGEVRRRGLATPVILGIVVAVVLGGVYIWNRSKKGKKGKTSGTKKTKKGAAS